MNSRHGEVFLFEPERKIPPDGRNGFETVIHTLQGKDARTEGARCLQCASLCNRCVETCPNRANVAVVFEPVRMTIPVWKDGVTHAGELSVRQTLQILHLDRFCNECGNCETFCPHTGGPYERKLTLFSDGESFESSRNSGFVAVSEEGGIRRFLCRADDIRFVLGIAFDRDEITFVLSTADGISPPLVFSVRDKKKPEFLSENGAANLDTAPLFGVWLVVDAVLRNAPWLLAG